jgi:integrase
MVAFLRFADAYYRRPDAGATNEADKYRTVIGVVRELHGHTPANEFGPRSLKDVRQAMIGRGWCRRLVNQQVGRVKRLFKWATEEELIAPTVYHGLAAVAGLKFGRTDARETEPIRPVDEAAVKATLPQLPRHVAGLVRFQLATGCRPGEACRVRRCDLDTSGPVWFFNPPTHKTTYRGRTRSIAVGTQGQALLAEFPTGDSADFVFSPARQVEEFHVARAANRKTPRWPSHQERNRAKRVKAAKKTPGANYTTERYARAVASGVIRENARRKRLAGEGNFDVIPHWHPNQLRHSFATRVRRQHGLEAAQVLLGHARADVTQVYAERDMQLAAEVAREVG